MSLELVAAHDTRVQGATTTQPLGGGDLVTGSAAHLSFVEFELSAVPANAEIQSAEFKLYFTGNAPGPNGTELGRVENDWDEATLISSDPMTVTWSGDVQPVDDVAGDLVFDVTSLVRKWHLGERPNYGFALRSTSNGNKHYHSRETSNQHPPRLAIEYTVPEPVVQGRLEFEHRVLNAAQPVKQGETLKSEIVVRHVGGSHAIGAHLTSLLAAVDTFESGRVAYSWSGSPGTTVSEFNPGNQYNSNPDVVWSATLPPDSEIRMQVADYIEEAPACPPFTAAQRLMAMTGGSAWDLEANAGDLDYDWPPTVRTSYLVDCQGEVGSQPAPGAGGPVRP